MSMAAAKNALQVEEELLPWACMKGSAVSLSRGDLQVLIAPFIADELSMYFSSKTVHGHCSNPYLLT